MIFDAVRTLARWLASYDPLVRLNAHRTCIALATTEKTASQLRRINAMQIHVLTQLAILQNDSKTISAKKKIPSDYILFISVGNLLAWKGTHLGILAFAKAAIPNSRYCIIGDGPEYKRLHCIAVTMGIADRVEFKGRLSRDAALAETARSDVLIHPSLHDSGGAVCMEAMAAGKPVICLDLGGQPFK